MVNKLIKEAKKNGINLEVLTSIKNIATIEVLNDNLRKFYIDNNKTYTLKAIYNEKKIVLSYKSIKDIDGIITNIKNIGCIIDNDNLDRLCENDYQNNDIRKIEYDYNKIKKDLLSLNSYKEKYPDILNVNSTAQVEISQTLIDNENHHLEDGYSCVEAYACASMSKNGVIKTRDVSYYGLDFDIDVIKKKMDEAIKDLELEFSATSISTNKYTVLLANRVVNSILKTMADMFLEKNIFMNLSLLKGKLGKKVFSDKITILEEPVNSKFIVNKHFDREGTLTYNKEIVKDGVFKLSLNNLEYAYKSNTKPTGNSNQLVNYHIKEGKCSFEELVVKLNNGVIIDDVEGLHAGINHITGDISLQAKGKMVKDGKIVKSLNMIILSTNINELLNNVIEVGSDLEEFDMVSSSPSLLVDNITISGSEE